ncbi:MAG: response regulator [Minwuia sp.]|uniref:response regulator n=1 Tax=Minwuia sp. TaxID=2493630 RepID=UPI003A87D6F2
MDEAAHILVIDDDSRLRDLLRRYLLDNGFRVTEAGTTAEAEERLRGIVFDLMILDVMLPGEDGRAFASRLRGAGQPVPILMLTALGDPGDRIAGLEAGVDDYLAKPFEPKELILRVQAILRRGRRAPAGPRLKFGRFVFDRNSRRLTEDGAHVRLTSGEAALLQALSGRPGETFGREALAGNIGNDGDPAGRAIDVQITRLRRKLEDDPRNPVHLITIRGEGYVLHATPSD